MSGNGTETREIAVRQHEPPTLGLTPRTMAEMVEVAKWMATAKLVPRHLQGDAGSCLMVVEQAVRWGMSPFAVAQGTSVIQGKLMYEGKLVAAAIEASGAIDGHMEYEFSGPAGDDRTVTVTAKRRGDLTPRAVHVRLGDAKTENIWWKKTPDQMLVYHGSRVWARRWTPAVILGVYSPEEWGRDVTATVAQFDGQTIEAEATETPPPATTPTPPPRRTARQVLDSLRRDAEAAMTLEDLASLRDTDEARALMALAEGHQARLQLEEILSAAQARLRPPSQRDELDTVLDSDAPDAYATRAARLCDLIRGAETPGAVRDILSVLINRNLMEELYRQNRKDLADMVIATRNERLAELGGQ